MMIILYYYCDDESTSARIRSVFTPSAIASETTGRGWQRERRGVVRPRARGFSFSRELNALRAIPPSSHHRHTPPLHFVFATYSIDDILLLFYFRFLSKGLDRTPSSVVSKRWIPIIGLWNIIIIAVAVIFYTLLFPIFFIDRRSVIMII